MSGIHVKGKDVKVKEVMRTDMPVVDVKAKLDVVRKVMQKYNTVAVPVGRKGAVIGVVTLEDINRVYMMMHE